MHKWNVLMFLRDSISIFKDTQSRLTNLWPTKGQNNKDIRYTLSCEIKTQCVLEIG